jgi:hypothetical protein
MYHHGADRYIDYLVIIIGTSFVNV